MSFSFIINGKAENINFTSFSITQRVDALADHFELNIARGRDVANRNSPPAPPATTMNNHLINTGDSIKIYWSGALLLTGHVEQRDISLDGQTHTTRLAGRSVAGDLVDCGFSKNQEWAKGSTLADIIHDMLTGFDIAFKPDNNQTLHSTNVFTVEAGMNIYQKLRSLGSAFGMFFSSLPDGNITAFKPSPNALPVFTAQWGVNILSLQIAQDDTVKFSPIIVEPAEALFGEPKKAIVKDATVRRHRPLWLQPPAEGITPSTKANFTLRSNLRRAHQISLTIPEILPLDPAAIIHIDLSEAHIKAGDYAISAQKLIADDRGMRTEFECVYPDALLNLHEPIGA